MASPVFRALGLFLAALTASLPWRAVNCFAGNSLRLFPAFVIFYLETVGAFVPNEAAVLRQDLLCGVKALILHLPADDDQIELDAVLVRVSDRPVHVILTRGDALEADVVRLAYLIPVVRPMAGGFDAEYLSRRE